MIYRSRAEQQSPADGRGNESGTFTGARKPRGHPFRELRRGLHGISAAQHPQPHGFAHRIRKPMRRERVMRVDDWNAGVSQPQSEHLTGAAVKPAAVFVAELREDLRARTQPAPRPPACCLRVEVARTLSAVTRPRRNTDLSSLAHCRERGAESVSIRGAGARARGNDALDLRTGSVTVLDTEPLMIPLPESGQQSASASANATTSPPPPPPPVVEACVLGASPMFYV